MNRIFITGATGHLGTAVIKQLLRKITTSQVSVLTRNEEKVKEFETKGFKAFCGSYADLEVLRNAMQDVDTVLLISSGDQGDRMLEHKNVIDTASSMGVKHIAYTSRCMKDRNSLENRLMEEHFVTEDLIAKSGLTYTFFRNVLYMDAIPQFIGGNTALEKGIFLPAGDGRVSFALRSEMGEAMANVLQTRDLPDAVISKIIDFISDIKNNQESAVFNDLEQQLGRKSTGLKGGLKLVFGI